MQNIPDLNKGTETVDTGNDSIVIRHMLSSIIGGKTLDIIPTEFPDSVIKAGHIVIRGKADGDYKPMPVSNGAYASLPSDYEYAGVVVCSTSVDMPFVGIMYAGEVNDLASPYPVTDTIKNALKTALPGLVFMHD